MEQNTGWDGGVRLDWPELQKGTLIKRYKRFLADVRLETGGVVTAHCPNSGSMLECSEPGRPVFISFHDNPRRKLKYTWELIEMPGSLVGVNTLTPNRLVYASAKAGVIPELSGYDAIRKEKKTIDQSRIDLFLSGDSRRGCFVEVKNCTLVREGVAAFPDAVTERGLKHLTTLQKLVHDGYRCVMFYLIQRSDASVFKPADFIHPEYGDGLRKAVDRGVEAIAYDVAITLKSIVLNRKIDIQL